MAIPAEGRHFPAWLAALINQLAFPGLGTILAGRKVGYVQAAIMLAGFLLTVGFLSWYLFCVARLAADPAQDEQMFTESYRPFLWALYSGLGLCAIAWFWALASSARILREEPSPR